MIAGAYEHSLDDVLPDSLESLDIRIENFHIDKLPPNLKILKLYGTITVNINSLPKSLVKLYVAEGDTYDKIKESNKFSHILKPRFQIKNKILQSFY